MSWDVKTKFILNNVIHLLVCEIIKSWKTFNSYHDLTLFVWQELNKNKINLVKYFVEAIYWLAIFSIKLNTYIFIFTDRNKHTLPIVMWRFMYVLTQGTILKSFSEWLCTSYFNLSMILPTSCTTAVFVDMSQWSSVVWGWKGSAVEGVLKSYSGQIF